jgi:hypothetical protein
MLTVLALGAAATGSTRKFSAPPPPEPPPTSQSGTAPVTALVDDGGAVLLRSVPGGRLEIEGVTRSGRVPPWKLVLRRDQHPLGCLRCPDVFVSDEAGRLYVARNGILVDVTIRVPLAVAVSGLPGLLPTSVPTLATADDPAHVIVRPLGNLAGSAVAALARPAGRFTLTAFQQTNGALAVTTAGQGIAVARLDALHPGTWRVQEVDRSRMVVDIEVPAQLGEVGSVDVAACLSPDGARAAVVVPEAGGFAVLSGAWGDTLTSRHVDATGRVLVCDVTSSGVAVAVQGEQGRLSVYRVDQGAVVEQRSTVPADYGQFCSGTGMFVSEGNLGAGLLRPGEPMRRLTTNGLAGCTAGGTIWTVANGEVSWFTPRR